MEPNSLTEWDVETLLEGGPALHRRFGGVAMIVSHRRFALVIDMDRDSAYTESHTEQAEEGQAPPSP